ncbi:CDP-glycerol glycerophosphotransferase family protein [Gramella jeungdoensis]|uniref:CDP-glycerol glycerophosphotransferase family protein n=1 Tax=Gramella jeungdoensis TaxID=708091 RepID=A0ABT0YXI7_9FLAO|nr:CDP-glycerol glycerophosphotransferase family protein [Gramella jeungdoensis]MCM8568166.1 CDP-glycerol glycerophosphotransferase family protein [Gramella jeungdoensis]
MQQKKKRIGFLYLDEIHHLFHFISVAAELAKTEDVEILTHPRCDDLLFESIEKLGDTNIKVRRLETKRFRRFTDKLKNRDLPRKGFWIKKHKKYLLENFDALIFTDYFHHYLLKWRTGAYPKLIKFGHGPPGRAYSYNKDLLDFDAQLLYGQFNYDQFEEMGILGPKPMTIGYPKIDVVEKDEKKEYFSNQKPTVIYNPHFDPEYTSWDKEGLKVLEYFYNQDRYNLIFAPHLNLFQELKGNRKLSEIPEKYFKADHILIDPGSVDSVNMAYTRYADIYLGDVSSQVFEFIIEPRPCIFLNPNNFDYKNDISFRFWKLGEVISGAEKLDQALKNTQHNFKEYKPIQEKMTAENFYSEKGSTASERAAKAIRDFLN